MKFFIDENIAPQIGRGLRILQEPLNKKGQDVEIYNIRDEYGQGVPDEEWIPKVGKVDGVVITEDISIHRTRHQRELYKQYGLGSVFLKPPSKKGFDYWTMVFKIIQTWPEIKKVAAKEQRPFAYIISSRATQPESLN